jgi:hypothetical protein
MRERMGDEAFAEWRVELAAKLFTQVALAEPLVEFLTLPAYDYID